MPPQYTIDQLVVAYNAHDARGFADCFAEQASIYEHPGTITQQGRNAIFQYYERVFTQYPQNHTTVLHRIVLGNRVIDHERVQRSSNQLPFEVLTIYELNDVGFIRRLDFVRDAVYIANVITP